MLYSPNWQSRIYLFKNLLLRQIFLTAKTNFSKTKVKCLDFSDVILLRFWRISIFYLIFFFRFLCLSEKILIEQVYQRTYFKLEAFESIILLKMCQDYKFQSCASNMFLFSYFIYFNFSTGGPIRSLSSSRFLFY